MSIQHVAAACLLIAGAPALAGSLDLNLRDRSAQLQYATALGTDSLKDTEMHVGYLQTEKENWLLDLGVRVGGAVLDQDKRLKMSVGLKGVAASVDHMDVGALAVGAEAQYRPFADGRLGFAARIYVSPNIVTYRDAERYLETGARVEYTLVPQATVYLGYRRMKFDMKDVPSDVVLDSGFHAGLRLDF